MIELVHCLYVLIKYLIACEGVVSAFIAEHSQHRGGVYDSTWGALKGETHLL